MISGRDEHDVVVIGDGPAGSALARACVELGLDVVLVGDDAAWIATYGTWADELERVEVIAGADVASGSPVDVVAWTTSRHDLDRGYVLLDNDALRDVLRQDVERVEDQVVRVTTGGTGASGGASGAGRTSSTTRARHRVELASGASIDARVVVDAAGWPASFAKQVLRDEEPLWQTAFGVVLDAPPSGDLGYPTLMDFREPPGTAPSAKRTRTATTFAYSLPVADGWLVEETVLAARPAIEPVALVPLLAARLHMTAESMLDRARRTEYVRIPMGVGRPRRDQPIVAFGAAAGYVNPTSGYSVIHSLQMATPVAIAIGAALDRTPQDRAADSAEVWDAIWPIDQRRTRVLHDYGLAVLGKLDGPAVREFFAAFFDLPTAAWTAYLRSDSSPAELSRVMLQLFMSAPWSTRRRLMRGNPTALARLVRPG